MRAVLSSRVPCTIAPLLLIFPSLVTAWNLTLLDTYYPPNHELMDVEVFGTHAYIPGGLGGLEIVDVADPASPVHVGTYYASGCDWGRMYAWWVGGDYAYGSGRYCGIRVINVSNPSNPQYETSYGDPAKSYEHADGDGTHLFAAMHADGVEIIDISAPPSPTYVKSVPTENAWAVDEYRGLLFVADGAGGLQIIDVATPEEAEILGGAPTSGVAKDVVANDDFAFVAVGAFGVDMFDVSDPTDPRFVANYNTSGYASRVALSDSLVAVSDWDDVEILRWDDSPSLVLAGYKKTNGRVMAIDMVSDIVFSAEWTEFRTFRFESVMAPDLDVSLHKVDFAYTDSGLCRDTTLYLRNNGQTDLELFGVSSDNLDFSFAPSHGIISAGGEIAGTLTYCASSEDDRGTLSIESDDPNESTLPVALYGNLPWGIEAGEAAPDFTLSSVNGFGDVTLSEYRGRVVVLGFFAVY